MAKRYVYSDVETFNAPGIHDVHIDVAMSNVSIAYRNETYIADKVFPVVKVVKQSDKYYKFTKDHWFRDEARVRAPGARAARVDYTLETSQYACVEYAAAKGVPDEVVDNADAPLKPVRDATDFVTDKLLLRQEKDVADLVFTSGNWTSTAAAGTKWDNDASDPIKDVLGTIRGTIRGLIGRYPNVCVLGAAVWEDLMRHPDIIDRIKYTTPGATPTPQLVANLFQIEKLLVGTAILNSSQEGVTASFSDVWGKSAFFGYVPNAPGLMVPAAGYVIAWKERQVNRYREDQEHQEVIECLANWDSIVTSADSGYLLTSVVD